MRSIWPNKMGQTLMHKHVCKHPNHFGLDLKIKKAKVKKISASERDRLANKLEPRIRREFLKAIDTIKSRTSIDEIVTALESGDPRRFEDLVMEDFRGNVSATMQVVRGGLQDSGALEAASVPRRISPKGFIFDAHKPETVEFINRYEFGLIQGIDETTRLGLRTIFRESQISGIPNRDKAKLIRPMIGLTDQQASSVFRRVKSAEAAGMPKDKLDKLHDKISARKIKERATVIARTETIRAGNAGQDAAWKQMVDKGLIPANTPRVWIVADDERLCPICESLDGVEVELGGEYNTTVQHSATRQVTYTAQYPPVHPACATRDHLIYTRNGFVPVDSVRIGDECLSLNPDSLQLEWANVVSTQEQKFDGDLVHFTRSNGSLDLLVTPDHNQPVYRRVDNGKTRNMFMRFMDADKVGESTENRIYVSSEHRQWAKQKTIIGYPEISFSRFMGWYLSEGSCSKRGEDHYQASITQKTHIPELIDALDEAGVLYRRSTQGRGVEIFSICDKDLKRWLFQFGKADKKFIPQEIMEASSEAQQAFLDAYILGDGHTRTSNCYGYESVSSSISTTSIRMRDQLVEIILRLGKSASFACYNPAGTVSHHYNGSYASNFDTWLISILSAKSRTPEIKRVPYKGKVYGLTLDKNHTLLTARNGRICWTGNCRCSLGLVFP